MSVDVGENMLFAVPKKGRLYERVLGMLEGMGLHYRRANRLDIANCSNLPVSLVFLPAKDIAYYVGEGQVDLGITGEDIIAEADVKINTLLKLGVGKCRLCVQGPVGKYKSAKELAGKRIVTSFPNLAAKYFAKYDSELSTKTSIKYVSGSVEAAIGLGLADGIVDLVETGTTMRAAGLEVVENIMQSQTVLVSNPNTKHPEMVSKLFKRIQGYIVAKNQCMISYNIPKAALEKAIAITPGHESPTITNLSDESWVSVSALIKVKGAQEIFDALEGVGAKSILTFAIDNCRFPTDFRRSLSGQLNGVLHEDGKEEK
mmetsp:Transcript_15645/g.28068  ORF Transcript_15645/g.28068 Transcript_15645/m.28068 type:complete len:316 (-) Transcript_15645:308-1255(-)|eukprot:CAMPEP_0197536064 /NCGR_PEP_ID=MMETSP1318-20131121/52779_1 /TAXON_ID=552666 /ORGANISM="Partenskyella glossopodia, Strain RCC365" /LENGTH=315 /DNA_ID=CAMNT_0043093843 /DNA_START=70 /DNA_END=1017 /DNA_ORIENTATION=-